MEIAEYIRERQDLFEQRSKLEKTGELIPLIYEGYGFIRREVEKNNKELNHQAITDINLLEGFLVTFIQYGKDFKMLRNIEAIVG